MEETTEVILLVSGMGRNDSTWVPVAAGPSVTPRTLARPSVFGVRTLYLIGMTGVEVRRHFPDITGGVPLLTLSFTL